jgi:hypothetical protein
MAGVVFLLKGAGLNIFAAVIVGWLVYAAALVLGGAFRNEDMALMGKAVPLGPIRRLLPLRG